MEFDGNWNRANILARRTFWNKTKAGTMILKMRSKYRNTIDFFLLGLGIGLLPFCIEKINEWKYTPLENIGIKRTSVDRPTVFEARHTKTW